MNGVNVSLNNRPMRIPEFDNLPEIETFDRNIFVGDDKETQRACNFVLALALVFNDLRDLEWVTFHLARAKPPADERVSCYRGEHGGFSTHAFKLLLSGFNEFMILIESEKSIWDVELMKNTMKQLSPMHKEYWEKIKLLAEGKQPDHEQLRKLFLFTRNKVGFHYGDTKPLGAAYANRFTKVEPTRENAPFVSLGNSTLNTRMYFADALVEAYMNDLGVKTGIQGLGNELADLSTQITHAIFHFVHSFVFVRGGAFRKFKP